MMNKNILSLSNERKPYHYLINQIWVVFVTIFMFCIPNKTIAQSRTFVNPGLEFGATTMSGVTYYDTNFGYNATFDAGSTITNPWFTSHPTSSLCNGGGTQGACHPIEVWVNNFNGVPAAQGNNFVELNAASASMIYQNMYLVPGDVISGSFKHRARVSGSEQAQWVIRDQNGAQIAVLATTTLPADTSKWITYNGNYTFTGSAGVYRVGFEALSGGGVGNFLDDIQIHTTPLIDLKSSMAATACEGRANGTLFLRISGKVEPGTVVAVELKNPNNGTAFASPADIQLTGTANSLGTPSITNSGNIYLITIPAGDYDGGTTPGYASPNNNEDGVRINIASLSDGISEPKETFRFEIKASGTNGSTNNFTAGLPVLGDVYTPETNDYFIDFCDSDGDGIPDIVDLDNDNDGILDCIENGFNGDPNSAFKTNANATGFTNPPGSAPINQFRLTNGGSQRGQAWSYGKIDFAKNFTISMKVLLSGADGIAIVFQNDPLGTAATGIDGQGLGARGIQNGIALELDTFTNSCANDSNNGGNCDPSYDHGSIRTTAGTATTGWTKLAGDGQLGDGTVDDGTWHNVVVTWDAFTQTISYTFDGAPVSNYTFPNTGSNAIANIFGGTTNVRFGFTGSTGATGSNNSIGFDNPCEIPLFFDTDGDGIPDYLDLDSDNDGCPDAIEGGDNVLNSQLNPNGSINSGVNPNGVPNLVNPGGAADVDGKVGQGIGYSQQSQVNACNDIDKDGIPDIFDLDNDNDGILDTVECLPSDLVQNGSFASSSNWTMSNWSLTSGQARITADTKIPNVNLLRQTLTGITSPTMVKLNFSTVFFNGGDRQRLDVYLGSVRYAVLTSSDGNGNVTVITENGAVSNIGSFAESSSFTTGWQNIQISFPYNSSVTSQELRFDSYTLAAGNGDDVGIDNVSFLILKCDTDGDGIPDYLDLDSDGDGCPDAVEGDENVKMNQLNTDRSININANGGVDAQGVPNLVNVGGVADGGNGTQGQGRGSAYDPNVNSCPPEVCYKPGNISGTPLQTKVGITSLKRAGANDPDNWPMVRKSGWIALESKTKPFVVNRVEFSGANPVGIPPADFVEGMMVYDTTNKCMKIYTLKSGDTSMAWHCLSKQTCDENAADL